MYLLSLGAGVLVGVIYSVMHVRSPAPPLVALVGLLGILGGEQIIPVSRLLLFGQPVSTAPRESHDAAQVPGVLFSRGSVEQATGENANSKENRT